LHRHNNQDHSTWTAILATLNLLDGASHDVWELDTDEEYFEQPSVAEPLIGDVPLVAEKAARTRGEKACASV
jgi:hypothetical protein